MITRTLVAVLAATASLAVAACGGKDEETPARSSSQGGKPTLDAASKKAMLQFAQCMRDHGVDMKDPTFDSSGRGGVLIQQDEHSDPEKIRTAEQACKKYQDQVKPPPVSEAQQKKMREAALANARCMREHGIDFPDPQFQEGGRMSQKLGGPGSGVDPTSQKFQDAMKACAKDAPGGMMFGGGPSGGSGQ